jgi:plastocyanin
MKTRREFLTAVGAIVGSLALPDMMPLIRAGPIDFVGRSEASTSGIVEIRMRSDGSGANVWFDPIGIYINPGKTVRWVVGENVHTTTAYHPKNDNHSLRIPENAVPWDSGYLVNPGDHFEVTLTAEGVYDYYCIPHEMAGMVGRIIVGRPIGPGAMPFDYYRGKPGTAGWQPVPEAARKAFPHIDRIMRERIVRR